MYIIVSLLMSLLQFLKKTKVKKENGLHSVWADSPSMFFGLGWFKPMLNLVGIRIRQEWIKAYVRVGQNELDIN